MTEKVMATFPITSRTNERAKRRRLDAESEYQEILKQLKKHGGNVTDVAREMNISRNTVYRKMRLYNIDY
jgi:transcriptional regulator of acetoin/glycerol metabolism